MYRAPPPPSSSPSSSYPKIGPHPHAAVRPPPYQQNSTPSSSCNSLSLSCALFDFLFPLIDNQYWEFLQYWMTLSKFSLVLWFPYDLWERETREITLFIEFAAGLGIKVAIKPEYRITPPVSSLCYHRQMRVRICALIEGFEFDHRALLFDACELWVTDCQFAFKCHLNGHASFVKFILILVSP